MFLKFVCDCLTWLPGLCSLIFEELGLFGGKKGKTEN